MKLQSKWELRQLVSRILAWPMSATALVWVLIGIRYCKYLEYGLYRKTAHGWQRLPYDWDAFCAFLKLNVWPLWTWALAAIVFDIFVRPFFFKRQRVLGPK